MGGGFGRKGKVDFSEQAVMISKAIKKQVQVKLISSGICHSQLHHMHDPQLTRPLSLGHEAVGIVTKVGPDSKYVKEGDHVIVTWVSRIPKTGRYVPTIEGITYKEKPVYVRMVFTCAETIISLIYKYPSPRAY